MREKVSFVVYKIVNNEPLFFVGKRPDKGIWLHPTGKLEDGENYIEGALREVREELGDVVILNLTDLKRDFTFTNEYGEFHESVVAIEVKDAVKVDDREFGEYDFLQQNNAIEIVNFENHKRNIHETGEIIASNQESRFFIFVAPTACGKSSIIKHLLENHAENFERVKTYMTRPFKRLEDELLRVYVSQDEFEALDQRGLLIEKNFHDGNWYGSSFKLIEEALKSGKNLIAEIDINGLKNLKTHFHNITSIFISAPLDEIEHRLRERGGHSEEEIRRRLEIAQREIAQKDYCDYVVNNVQGELDRTIRTIEEITLRELGESEFKNGTAGLLKNA